MTYEDALKVLAQYNQEHVLRFYNKLNFEKKDNLLDQITNIDFELMNRLYNKAIKGEKVKSDNLSPMSVIDKEKLSQEEVDTAINIGEKSIKKGELAFVTMAGRTRN